MKDEQVIEHLTEDTGSPEDAGRLLPIVRRLTDGQAPAPTHQETARLAGTLRHLLVRPVDRSLTGRLRFGWLLLRSQIRVVQQEIWAASAIVMGLGTLITLTYTSANTENVALPFVLVAPLAAAAGIAFLYGPAVDPALEIELTLPVSPRQVLAARLALVFGFDLLFGLAGSALLAGLRSQVLFWPLVSAWLAPMAFLAALAFLLITISLEPGFSLLACFGLWVIQAMARYTPGLRLPFILPDLTAAAARPWLWLLAILMGGAAFWLGGGEEGWLRRRG